MACCNEKTFEEISINHRITLASEEQMPTEATLIFAEITPTPPGAGTEELLSIEMIAPLTLSSSKLDQLLHPIKKFRHLRRGYEPSSSRIVASLILPLGPSMVPNDLLASLALTSPLTPLDPSKSSLAPISTPSLPQEP